MKKKLSEILLVGLMVLTLCYIIINVEKINFNNSNYKHEEEDQLDNEPFDEQEFIPTRYNIDRIQSFDDITRYLYTIDPTAYVADDDLKINEYLHMNFKTEWSTLPKVLIFHTHSQEAFIDSRPDIEDDSIVGVGKYLAEILVNEYNISVIHDIGQYDIKNGKLNRESSYETMEPAVSCILSQYPSIEILIDVHRDGVPDNVHLVTTVNGKPTARLMLFNGVTSYNSKGKPKKLPELVNPYLNDNLGLSFNLQLTANELYPGLMRKIYIRPYRYSLHLKPKSMLLEVGANTNTVQEAKNAMHPFAEIIAREMFY